MQDEIRSLTALRGIVALWVVLYHYAHHVIWIPAELIIKQGALAVDVFFTLSGFILVHVYCNGFRTIDFLMKRFARLYPVHLVTLLGVISLILVGRAMGVRVDGGLLADDMFTHFLALHSTGINDSLALNYPSWSISAEFFAYLTFPLFLPLVMKQDLRLVVPVAIGFFVACVGIADATGRPITARTYDFSIIRILPEFLLGMVAARLCLEKKISVELCSAAAVVLLVTGILAEQSLMIILAAPLLIAALYFTRWPIPSALRYLGVISYSLYMVHALVEKLGFSLFETLLGQEKLPTWTLFANVAIAIVCASVLYHWVEQPGRRLIMTAYARRH